MYMHTHVLSLSIYIYTSGPWFWDFGRIGTSRPMPAHPTIQPKGASSKPCRLYSGLRGRERTKTTRQLHKDVHHQRTTYINMCSYICIFTCICLHASVSVDVYIYTYNHIYINVYVYIYTYKDMCICIYIHTFAYICIYTYTCVYTEIYMYDIYMCVYTYTYIHTCIFRIRPGVFQHPPSKPRVNPTGVTR